MRARLEEWLGSFFYRSRMYCYAPVLMIFEVGLRNGFHAFHAQSFIGPSIAAAGASLLIPLTLEKPLTPERLAQLPKGIANEVGVTQKRPVVSVMLRKERNFMGACWMFVILGTGAWFASLYLAVGHSDWAWGLPANYWPGMGVYVLSIILSEVREELI